MKKIELLAPAGSLESLIAAVQSGADAVYLGGSKFSARAYASNFDDEKMTSAIEYCHLYGVKVYVTLNTLIKDKEIEEVLKYAIFLYNIGVDALIVQDAGLISLLKTHLPELEIHASTQMTVHNGEGALYLKELGFERIVLSRELSLKEIEYISKDLNIETEIFIHGALCICYSGQCLMSSVIGGRSGNRGRCAQPCRLPYKLIDKARGKEKKGYLLSPKDICTLENIEEIIMSGTSSLKIEGRMKRPEYVAGVVDIYRRAIDSVYNKTYFDAQKEMKTLTQLFNREGFSKAYFFGNTGKDMMAYNFPKNTGVKLGKVLNDSNILLMESLSLGDGVRIGDKGFTVSKIIKDSNEVKEAYKGDKVKLKPAKYKKNDILFKTADNILLNKLSEVYKNPYAKKINLKASIKFEVNKPVIIETTFNNKEFKVYGDIVQTALKKPLDKERIIKNLSKTGDIPFKLDEIIFETFEAGFLPMSSINNTRRELLGKIEKDIKTKYKRKTDLHEIKHLQSIEKEECKIAKGPSNLSVKASDEENLMPKDIVTVYTSKQLQAAVQEGMENIAINLFMKGCNIDIKNIKVKNLYLIIPNIIRNNEFEGICNIVEEYIDTIKGIITANLGIISKYQGRTSILGDYKLNILNSNGVELYKKVLSGIYLSAELNRNELTKIANNTNNYPCGVIIYGKYELMVSEYCPIGSVFRGKDSRISCEGECSKGSYVLKDRMGEEFPVKTDKYCRSYIYNNAPTNLIDNMEDLVKRNINHFRLDFVDESYEEVKKVITSFKQKKWISEFSGYTRGHYKRGVE